MRAKEFVQIGREAEYVVWWDKESLQKLGLSPDKLSLILDAFIMLLQEAVATIRDFPEDIQPLISDLYEEKLANLAEVHRLLRSEPDSMEKCELMGRKVSESHIQKLSKTGLAIGQVKKVLLSLGDLQIKVTSSTVSLPRNVPFVEMAREQFIKLRKIHDRTSRSFSSLRSSSSYGLNFLAVRTAMTFALISTAGLSQEEADKIRNHLMFFVGIFMVMREDLAVKLRILFIGITLDMLDLVQSEGYLAENVLEPLKDRIEDAYHHAWIRLDRKTLASLNALELDFLADAYASLGGYFIDQARTFTPLMMRVFARAALNQVDAEDKYAQTRN